MYVHIDIHTGKTSTHITFKGRTSEHIEYKIFTKDRFGARSLECQVEELSLYSAGQLDCVALFGSRTIIHTKKLDQHVP